jgi:hypothetical protein
MALLSGDLGSLDKIYERVYNYTMESINVKDTYTKEIPEGGAPQFWDLQRSFYEWTESVGLGYSYGRYPAIQNAPTYWSRAQFRAFVAKNPDREDIWKFKVGAQASPLPFGGTGGSPASFLDGPNYLYVLGWIIGSLFLFLFGMILGSVISPLFLLLSLALPALGMYRKITVYNLMKDTWGKK